MNTKHHPRRARLQAASLSAVLTASLFAVLALPAGAGTTQVSGSGVFNIECQPPVGEAPDDPGKTYPPIDMSGSLDGCWYTYVAEARATSSGAYLEQGSELFVGCLNGTACGSFTTVYTFTGKFEEDGAEIHGRCEHRIVDGTGDFAGAKGVLTFKDDVVNLVFDYRGQILLASPGTQEVATIVLDSAKLSGSAEADGLGGC